MLTVSACRVPALDGAPRSAHRSAAATAPTRAGARPTGPEPTSCPNGGQLIEAVDIPAVHADPVHVPEQTIGGQKIPAATIPGVDIPAQRVPAQCVDIRPAPGGCLSAVSIPPTSIPATSIPAAEIPGVHAGGIDLPPQRADAQTGLAQYAKQQAAAETCQIKPKQGGLAPTVTRPTITRPTVTRPTVTRPTITRPSACNSNGECIESVTVPAVTVESVTVPSVTVESAELAARQVGRSEEIEGEDSIAYSIKADVLFDFDKATIKPEAVAELRRIAQDIKSNVPAGGRIQVDGHTDGKGDHAYNQTLSERRAKAIVEWLATKGGIDRARLAAKGYAETKPVAPNTRADGSDNPPGRAKNRRVVISARRGAG